MLSHRILWIGRRAQDPLITAAESYTKRIRHYANIDIVMLRDGSPEQEESRLLKHLPQKDYIIALDERGHQYTSKKWAHKIQSLEYESKNRLCYVVGGADGLTSRLRDMANETISLSSMTLPHRLALVVLLEQIYRAHTIMRGERYHRQ